jgi:Flp pilus assembly protein TadG
MVEFALILPLLLLLIFGILEFGRAINYWIDANHLANVAARWAVVNNNPGTADSQTLQQEILDQADSDEMQAAAQVCIEFQDDTPEIGEWVEAKVTVDFDWMPYMDNVLGVGSTKLTGTARMRLEQEPTEYDDLCESAPA